MSSTAKTVLSLVLTVVIAWWLLQIAYSIVMAVVYWLLPLAVVTGILYVLYTTVGKKIIGSGRRTLP